MRLLHIDTETGFRGGERQVQLLVHGLRKRGVENLIAGPAGGELSTKLREEGFSVFEYTKPGMLGVRSPFLIQQIRNATDRFRADIVHAHTGNAHTIATSAFLGSLPVVTTRRVDFAIKQNYFSRKKYTAPGQHFIAISNGVRDVLLSGGVAAETISLVHSGVEFHRVRDGNGRKLRGEWLEEDFGPLIGFVGALVDHKAPWILAQAAPMIRRELPGARVVFIGEGECRPSIEAIRNEHPEAIILAGWRSDIADCYAALDIFVMPSKLEGLCTSLVDALAVGVPSVASRAGGIPDVVVDGETGVLVPPEDATALAQAVVELWRDEARRKRFSDAGRRHAEAHFSADAMVEGTLSVYRKILSP
jgi:glycosyltransferase involved in cell wall biosynthesis